MGLLSDIGDIFDDVVDLTVDAVEGVGGAAWDVVKGVEATVEGALSGDPMAIASLAAMAYGAYSIYSAYAAASAGTAATTSATTSATTTTTTSAAGASGAGASQASVNQAFMEQVGQSIVEQGGGLTQAEVQSIAKAAGQEVVEEQTKKLTLTEVLKAGGKQAATSLTSTAATALLAKPDIELPTVQRRAASEQFDVSPNVQIGTGFTPEGTGGISKGNSQFENLLTIGTIEANKRKTNLTI